jgi:DNA repair protein RadC
MSIKDWPADERPREKLLQRGAHALTDAELLAIFLRTGTPGRSAVDMARDLLDEFGSLQHLLAADRKRFCASRGLGDAKYVQLQAVLEMARRHFAEVIQRDSALTNPDATRAYLSAQLRGHAYELFGCLFMDNQHHVIAWEILFRGTLDSTSVYPREVVQRALYHHAAAVIFAHNHPSGLLQASQADRLITEKLRHALGLLDIRVLDHFIIGNGPPYSFAEHGLL